MVNNAMSFTGSGLRDWVVQRVTAVILGAYLVFMIGFFAMHPNLQYQDWHSLFASNYMKLGTLFMLGALSLHAWVGVWTILTDYVKPVFLRFFLEIVVILALIAFFVWGIDIIWSIK